MEFIKNIIFFSLFCINLFGCTKTDSKILDLEQIENSKYFSYIKDNRVLSEGYQDDINKQIHGYTPLQYLVTNQLTNIDFEEEKSIEVLETFLENGANINYLFEKEYREKIDVIGICIENRYNKYIKILLKYYTGKLPDLDENGLNYLHLAVNYRNSYILRFLIPFIKNINGVNDKNQTALYYAAASDVNEDVIDLLLKSGADKTIKDIDGKTACDVYIEYFNRFDDVYKLLKNN